MPKAKAKSQSVTPATVVPHTEGLPYGALCRTRRVPSIPIAKGTLLARDGAWQNKIVVAYVVYGGCYTDQHSHERHVFVVGLLPLGRFYADGRMVPGAAQAVREVELTTSDGTVSVHNLGGWCPVEPFGTLPDQMLLGGKSYAGDGKSYSYGHELVADGGGQPTPVKTVKQAKAAAAPPPPPPQPPEAVLDQFLVN